MPASKERGRLPSSPAPDTEPDATEAQARGTSSSSTATLIISMEDLRATVYALVKEWSETKGLDPQLVLMSAGAATLLGTF